jgi:hypothetical protein
VAVAETEESSDRFADLMGVELGSAFEVLSQDLILAFANWGLYKQLYSDPQRERVLVESAGTFFILLRSILREDVVLQIARLVDRPTTGDKRNLTLQCLPELVCAACADTDLVCEVQTAVQAARDTCDFAVTWRNRRIAHRDWGVALGTSDLPLPDFELATIDQALNALAALLNRIESFFAFGAMTAYEFVVVSQVDSLFYFLRKGMDAAEAETGL